jgi:hypothetical protein
MSKITKDTLIPLGLVLTALGAAFKAGSLQNKYDGVMTRVEAIETDRKAVLSKYQDFQREVIERLARIEANTEAQRNSRR